MTGLKFSAAMLHLLSITGCLKECLEVPGCDLMFSPKITSSGECKSSHGILVSLCMGSKRQLAQCAAPLRHPLLARVADSSHHSSCAAFPILMRPLLLSGLTCEKKMGFTEQQYLDFGNISFSLFPQWSREIFLLARLLLSKMSNFSELLY